MFPSVPQLTEVSRKMLQSRLRMLRQMMSKWFSSIVGTAFTAAGPGKKAYMRIKSPSVLRLVLINIVALP